MAYEQWGPLGGPVGTWEGDQGLDVSFHNDHGKVAETPYREKTSFKPFGPVDNGRQCLYGLDYRTAAWRGDEENPFHTEVGYWLWDARRHQVHALLHGAARLDDHRGRHRRARTRRSFVLEADLGSTIYGILSNKYLDEFARTTRFDVTITIEGDTFRYDETTTVEHSKSPDAHLAHRPQHPARVSLEA